MSAVSELMSGLQAPAMEEATGTSKKSNVSGKTVSNPQLSEKAAKYYEELKSKYHNMEFVLVSRDQKDVAKAQAGKYASANKMVVLIDEDKIEKMANDKAYREQYEGIIKNAASGLSQLASQMQSKSGVKGFGMQVNDIGTTSFFAVMDKSFAAQRERMAKAAEKKHEEKMAAKKKEKKEAAEERLEKIREGNGISNDTEIITASSMDELLQKMDDFWQMSMTDYVQTPQEQTIGQSIDFSL